MQDGAPPLQALARAFAVLELFGADHPEWGTRLREVAVEMDAPLGLQVPELAWP